MARLDSEINFKKVDFFGDNYFREIWNACEEAGYSEYEVLIDEEWDEYGNHILRVHTGIEFDKEGNSSYDDLYVFVDGFLVDADEFQ